LLAILALLTVRVRYFFWPLVWAFNLAGLADLAMDRVRVVRMDVPSLARDLEWDMLISVSSLLDGFRWAKSEGLIGTTDESRGVQRGQAVAVRITADDNPQTSTKRVDKCLKYCGNEAVQRCASDQTRKR
jgi:hypothetical protein